MNPVIINTACGQWMTLAKMNTSTGGPFMVALKTVLKAFMA
jgi:hypothetical protein